MVIKKTKTEKSETETYTYGIPVYKYTGIDTALEGAKFILSTNEQPSESNAIKFNPMVQFIVIVLIRQKEI